jgi:hypothetical protein
LNDSHEDEQEERLRILAELIGGKETGAIIQLLFSATAGPTSR